MHFVPFQLCLASPQGFRPELRPLHAKWAGDRLEQPDRNGALLALSKRYCFVLFFGRRIHSFAVQVFSFAVGVRRWCCCLDDRVKSPRMHGHLRGSDAHGISVLVIGYIVLVGNLYKL